MYVSPPFTGPEAEARLNIASHRFRPVSLFQRYSESSEDWDPVEECQQCHVLADSERSRYPCGAAPPALKFDEWFSKKTKKSA